MINKDTTHHKQEQRVATLYGERGRHVEGEAMWDCATYPENEKKKGK